MNQHLILEVGLALGLIAFAVWLASKLRLSNVPFLILIGMALIAKGQGRAPIVQAARKRSGKSMSEKLAAEFVDRVLRRR